MHGKDNLKLVNNNSVEKKETGMGLGKRQWNRKARWKLPSTYTSRKQL